jgi:putative hydrolase of the HAD superfamily
MAVIIKNVVFDVGNVFVRWSPPEIIERCFNIPRGLEANQARAAELFGTSLWKAINRGELTRSEAENAYCLQHGLSPRESEALFFHAMDHQTAIEGTENLALRLKEAGYGVFGLTDNVREIVSHSRVAD